MEFFTMSAMNGIGDNMNRFHILVADNKEESLTTYGEYLENHGYIVHKASSPEEARYLLENTRLHFAILDLRLERDEDEKDKSGLQIAKQAARSVPKMILTNFPAYQDVVEVMKQDVHHLQPAVEFLDKRTTKLADLATAVAEALQKYVQINWELVIHWESHGSFAQFVYLLEPNLPQEYLGERTAELEDLFRKLFNEYTQITIGRMLAEGADRLILPVFAFNHSGVETRFLVSCGWQTAVWEENERYEKVVPQRFGIKNIGKLNTADTVHFGAIAYTFMGSDLEATTTLRQFYKKANAEEIVAAITSLYRDNLAAWYKSGRCQQPEIDLHSFYGRWLALPDPAQTQEHLTDIAQDIAVKALANNLTEITLNPRHIEFRLSPDETLTLPNPIYAWANLKESHRSVVWGITHGRLHGDTVLVDAQGKAWVIDFAQVSQAPLLIDFVSLETAVKFDLLDANNCQDRCHLEERLRQAGSLAENLTMEDADDRVVQILAALTAVLQSAAELAGCDLEAYNEALYHCAIARLSRYDPHVFYTPRILATYVHTLLSTALLSTTFIGPPTPSDLPPEGTTGLWLDETNKTVWVEGQAIDLTAQDYTILAYLYQRANQLCLKKEIVEQALNEPYDPYDREQSRLNTAMSRLRRKLEPDNKSPKYLITVRAQGYRLMTEKNP